MLKRQCMDAGGQKAWADMHHVSPQYVCDALQGRRDVGALISEALGLQRVIFYEPQQMAPVERLTKRVA